MVNGKMIKKNGNGLLCFNDEDYQKIISYRFTKNNINDVFVLQLKIHFIKENLLII